MPLDPATIRATAQRVVDEWKSRALIPQHWDGWSDFGSDDQSRFIALVQAGADIAAQSHATALADAEREAAREAMTKYARHVTACVNHNGRYSTTAESVRAWRDDHYPAPREVVKCALCRQPGADLSTGTHPTRDECIEALGKAFATTEGAR